MCICLDVLQEEIKNMLLDLVRLYKEQEFQLKGNSEFYHVIFKTSKIFPSVGSLSSHILAPTPPSTKKLIPTFMSLCLVSYLTPHINSFMTGVVII